MDRIGRSGSPEYAATAFQPSGKNQPESFESQLDTKRKLFSILVSLRTL